MAWIARTWLTVAHTTTGAAVAIAVGLAVAAGPAVGAATRWPSPLPLSDAVDFVPTVSGNSSGHGCTNTRLAHGGLRRCRLGLIRDRLRSVGLLYLRYSFCLADAGRWYSSRADYNGQVPYGAAVTREHVCRPCGRDVPRT